MTYSCYVLNGLEHEKNGVDKEGINSVIKRTSMPNTARGTVSKSLEYVSGLTGAEKSLLEAIGTELQDIVGENSREIESDDVNARMQNTLENLSKLERDVLSSREKIPATINVSEEDSKERSKAIIKQGSNGRFSYSLTKPFSKIFDGIAISLSDMVPGESYYEKRFETLTGENPNIDKEVQEKGKAVARARTRSKVIPTHNNQASFDSLNSQLKSLNIRQAEIAKASQELSTFKTVMGNKESVENYLTLVENYDSKIAEVKELQGKIDSLFRSADSLDIEKAVLQAIQKKSISLDDVGSFTNGVLLGRIGIKQGNGLSENGSDSVALSGVSSVYYGLKQYITDKVSERNIAKGYVPEADMGSIVDGELWKKFREYDKLKNKDEMLTYKINEQLGLEGHEQGEKE